jgi:hypothetical protein
MMESTLTANGAGISRIDGFVKMTKSNKKSRQLGKTTIFQQGFLK